MALITRCLTTLTVWYLLAVRVFTIDQNEDGTCPAPQSTDPDTESSESCSAESTKPDKVDGQAPLEFMLSRPELESIVIDVDENVELDGEIFRRRYVSKKPLLYEIKDFLSKEECETLIAEAMKIGLTKGFTQQHGGGSGPRLVFYDQNTDGRLSISEMRLTLEDNFDMYFTPNDVRKMYKELNLDPNGDDMVTRAEMEEAGDKVSKQNWSGYLWRYTEKRPWLRGRNSEHAWIFPNENKNHIVASIVQRVSKLINIPMVMMNKSDLQLVHYHTGGHYNAHHDSSELMKSVPCCRRLGSGPSGQCRSCRWMTVLFYLTDVEEGGETAFPIADDEVFESHKFRQSHHLDLNLHCKDANVRVKPEIGKAVAWFNHFVDPDNGWAGPQDDFGVHGSCPILKGEKWIANFWIKFTDDKEFDLAPFVS